MTILDSSYFWSRFITTWTYWTRFGYNCVGFTVVDTIRSQRCIAGVQVYLRSCAQVIPELARTLPIFVGEVQRLTDNKWVVVSIYSASKSTRESCLNHNTLIVLAKYLEALWSKIPCMHNGQLLHDWLVLSWPLVAIEPEKARTAPFRIPASQRMCYERSHRQESSHRSACVLSFWWSEYDVSILVVAGCMSLDEIQPCISKLDLSARNMACDLDWPIQGAATSLQE